MADYAVEPHPEQIVSLEGKEIEFNPEALLDILLQDVVKDKPVCVVSVTGASREDNSFLLNLLIRYLTVTYKSKTMQTSGWLRSVDGPVVGFPYRGNNTPGILMWSEIFLAKLSWDKEVAIILLDTQAESFDVTTATNCAPIFALSTLISTVQIYNLKGNIKESDLAQFECFSGYGQLLSNSDEPPFQSLVFLTHGQKVGEKGALQEIDDFCDTEENSTKSVALKENLRELFKKICCFSLPYPQLKAGSLRTFKGSVEDIDDTFKQQVVAFIPKILSTENLIPKILNCKSIKTRDLFQFIETYWSCFQSGEVPALHSLFMASSNAHHSIVLTESIMFYEQQMSCVNDKATKSVDPNSLYGIHCCSKNKAVQFCRLKKIIGNKEIKRNFEVKLKQLLEEKFLEYKTLNEIKYKNEQELAQLIQLREQQLVQTKQYFEKEIQQLQEQLRQERTKREQSDWKLQQLQKELLQLRSDQSSLQSSLGQLEF